MCTNKIQLFHYINILENENDGNSIHASFTSIYSTSKCGLGLISILAFFQYWQHILNERVQVVIYNKTHADDGL